MNAAVRSVSLGGKEVAVPAWYAWAINEIGTRELPDNRGPAIRRYIELAHVGKEGWPWCAIFANAAFEASGVPGTRSAGSQSFAQSTKFTALKKPVLGCVVVYWRGSKKSGLGHVGFYNGEVGDYISTVGGNESDMVREEMFPRSSKAFGLIGYFWPRDVSTDGYSVGPFPPVVAHGTKGATGKVV